MGTAGRPAARRRGKGAVGLLAAGCNALLLRREPLTLVHFVTLRCPARCRHCFVDFDRATPAAEELSLAEIETLADHVGRSLFAVHLTGGEPFVRDDLHDIAACYLDRTNARSIVVTTNGFFTDAVRDLVERFSLASRRGALKVSVSVDDLEDRHDRNRGVQGLFRRALESYHAAAAVGDPRIHADVVITVTPDNASRVLDLHARLKFLGVRSFTAVLLREEGVVGGFDRRDETVAAYRALVRSIGSDPDRPREPGRLHRAIESVRDRKNAIAAREVAGPGSSSADAAPCTAGSLLGVIQPGGDVYPCEMLPDARLGNLREHDMDFMAIWRSTAASACREKIRRSRCFCTYECARSTTILSRPGLAPGLAYRACRELLWPTRG